ncbi:hypothetical protein [Streptomyces sp. Agncl-13]
MTSTAHRLEHLEFTKPLPVEDVHPVDGTITARGPRTARHRSPMHT